MELFRLQNEFIISSLTHKWTKERVNCELVDNFEEQQLLGSTVQKMSVQNMLGVFILLAISVLVGFLIMIMEWIYASAKDARKRVQGRKTCCQACGTRLIQALRDMCCSKKKTTLDSDKTDYWIWTSGLRYEWTVEFERDQHFAFLNLSSLITNDVFDPLIVKMFCFLLGYTYWSVQVVSRLFPFLSIALRRRGSQFLTQKRLCHICPVVFSWGVWTMV